MTYRGHVRDGKIALDEPASLPEGAEVNVEVIDGGDSHHGVHKKTRRSRAFQPIEMPGGPLSEAIANDRR